MTANRPVGSVQPDIRGRVSLTKYLPPAPGLYLIYADPATGIIELHPAAAQGEKEAA